MTALDKGDPPPVIPVPRRSSRGAAYLARKTLAISHDFFADEEHMDHVLRVGTPRLLQDARMVLDNPFFTDDNYEMYVNLMEIWEVARDILLQRSTL
jgi:hypothetical protein